MMENTRLTPEVERQASKMEGIRRAWFGLEDTERQAGIAFFVRYAKAHQRFQGGDVLAAWRDTDDPIAQKDWRNRWGAMCKAMASGKWGVIKAVGREMPKNVQSHGDYATVWESQIYISDGFGGAL
jgi:hypothetical protein